MLDREVSKGSKPSVKPDSSWVEAIAEELNGEAEKMQIKKPSGAFIPKDPMQSFKLQANKVKYPY